MIVGLVVNKKHKEMKTIELILIKVSKKIRNSIAQKDGYTKREELWLDYKNDEVFMFI